MKNTNLQTETSSSRAVDEKGFEAETGLSNDRKYSVYFGSYVTKEMSVMYVPVNVQEVANLVQVSVHFQAKSNSRVLSKSKRAHHAELAVPKWGSRVNFNFGTSLTCLYMTEIILPAACSQSEHKKQKAAFCYGATTAGISPKDSEKHSRFPLGTHGCIKYVPKSIWHYPWGAQETFGASPLQGQQVDPLGSRGQILSPLCCYFSQPTSKVSTPKARVVRALCLLSMCHHQPQKQRAQPWARM